MQIRIPHFLFSWCIHFHGLQINDTEKIQIFSVRAKSSVLLSDPYVLNGS